MACVELVVGLVASLFLATNGKLAGGLLADP